MKICTKCGVEKPLDDYHQRRDTGKHRSVCKACTNAATLYRYHNDPEVKKAHRKASRKHALKKYGLTEEQFMQMHEDQKGKCVICSAEIPTIHENRYESCCVDHCHSSGKVRGLLCWDCNVGLGKFFDNPQLLEKAAEYLRSTR